MYGILYASLCLYLVYRILFGHRSSFTMLPSSRSTRTLSPLGRNERAEPTPQTDEAGETCQDFLENDINGWWENDINGWYLLDFEHAKLEPFFLKPFVPSCWGSRCQVGHLQTHSALVVGMGMWWAILISGSMKTCLHSIYRFSEVTIVFVSMWVGTWLFWNEFSNGSSLGMNHLIAFRCFGLVVENQ